MSDERGDRKGVHRGEGGNITCSDMEPRIFTRGLFLQIGDGVCRRWAENLGLFGQLATSQGKLKRIERD